MGFLKIGFLDYRRPRKPCQIKDGLIMDYLLTRPGTLAKKAHCQVTGAVWI
jgi:hypothetical protein